jgi:hypothetical protein
MKNNGFKKSRYWIAANGIPLSKDIRYSLTPEAYRLLCKVSDRTTIRHNYDQMEEAFSCILANLYHADILNEPLIYSRNSNRYIIERQRYGYKFYTYDMVIRLVDAMYELGLIQGVKGRKVANGRNKPSKMWATDDLSDLISSMDNTMFIKRPGDVIQLKDEDKLVINYRDNNATWRMRRQLNELNEMLSSLDLAFQFNYGQLSDRAKAKIAKLNKLRSLIHTEQIQIANDTILLSTLVRDILRDNLSERYNKRHTTKYYVHYDHDAKLSNYLGGLEFSGTVNRDANFMKRVFNGDWQHGGRFYQAPHITIPSICRKSMIINGETTVELDYSGLHIRMLYHLIGVDYRDECYVYEKSDKANKPDRDRIKLASLIVINSDDRGKAIKAIHDQCRRKGINYPAGEFGRYRSLVDRFEDYHERIKEYFLKGKGLELQYLDSTIMANILDRLTKQNIPALPVHDSVICPAQHEDFLRQVMIEEYQKIMGFEPVID